MGLAPIQVTAFLVNGLSVHDDYSPDLASILEGVWLKRHNLFQPNPTIETIITPDLPIAKHMLEDDWLWAVSSPCYQYKLAYIDKARKRWDADYNYPINWADKKANIQTNGGRFKSADKAVPVRLTNTVTWYAVGDIEAVEDLLSDCTEIGHRRNIGFGQVIQWAVQRVAEDWSLMRDGALMTAVPRRLTAALPTIDQFRIIRWNTKAPRWDKTQAELCFMPVGLVTSP